MKKLTILGLAIALGLQGDMAFGQDQERLSGWCLSLGANWRTFGEIDIKAFDFSPGNDTFVNGSVRDVGVGLFEYNVSSSIKQVDSFSLSKIEFQKATLPATGYDLRSAPGAMLLLARPFSETDEFTFEFELSLTTAFLRNDLSLIAETTAFQFDVLPNAWTNANAPAPGGGPAPSILSEIFSAYNRTQILTPNTSLMGLVNYDLNLNVYTVGAGVNLAGTAGGVRFLAGAGPALTVIDYDVERQTSVGWSDGSGTVFRSRRSNHGTAVRGGVYVRAGMEWLLSETVSVGIAGRYDYVTSELRAGTAQLDLSGLSGQVVLTLGF